MRSGAGLIIIGVFGAISSCAELDKMTRENSMSLQGCVAGGVGAGALAYLKYHNDKDGKHKIALITAIGCMAGGIAGLEIGKRTQKYVDAETAAREEIKRNSENIEKLRKVNAKLRANIEDYRRQISELKQSTFSAEEKQEQMKSIKKYLGEQKTRATQSLQSVEKEIVAANNQLRQFQSGVKRDELQIWKEKLAGLEREKQILSGHVQTLNAMDMSI